MKSNPIILAAITAMVLVFKPTSYAVGGASKRLNSGYDNSKVTADSLYAEIEERRKEREGKEGANLFVGVTSFSDRQEMIDALQMDDEENKGDAGKDKDKDGKDKVKPAAAGGLPPAGHESALAGTALPPKHDPKLPGTAGLTASGEPISDSQKDAAKKESEAANQRTGHVAQTRREQAQSQRLPVNND